MNTSIELNLQSIIVDALMLETEFLKGRACYHTGEILTRNGFKDAGAGFTFSFTRPINIPIPDVSDDAKTSLLNIEVGLPNPSNGFEYTIRINFPVTFQLEEDAKGKCGILTLISSRVPFVPYIRFASIRVNESEDSEHELELEGELVKPFQMCVGLVVNKRGMSFNPRILEDITIAFNEDDIDWNKLRPLVIEQHLWNICR